MFEACLTLPKDRSEAKIIADNLDALSRALRDWPAEAWQTLSSREPNSELFERLAVRTAPAALDPMHRASAMNSASAVADVLRVLWPETVLAPN